MKELKQVLILFTIILVVALTSHAIGLNKANTADLSDFKEQLDSIVTNLKQIGYDSAISEIRYQNLDGIKKGLK